MKLKLFLFIPLSPLLGLSMTSPKKVKPALRKTVTQCEGTQTPETPEGPYYKAGSPKTNTLFKEGIPGEKLELKGQVFDTDCQPLKNVWLDFWQANGEGQYDLQGFNLRGHQYTDDSGKYSLETVVPGKYTRRTPHIHVKLRANENSPVITSQLFFPGLATNKADFIYRDDLVMSIKKTSKGKIGEFNFVIPPGVAD